MYSIPNFAKIVNQMMAWSEDNVEHTLVLRGAEFSGINVSDVYGRNIIARANPYKRYDDLDNIYSTLYHNTLAIETVGSDEPAVTLNSSGLYFKQGASYGKDYITFRNPVENLETTLRAETVHVDRKSDGSGIYTLYDSNNRDGTDFSAAHELCEYPSTELSPTYLEDLVPGNVIIRRDGTSPSVNANVVDIWVIIPKPIVSESESYPPIRLYSLAVSYCDGGDNGTWVSQIVPDLVTIAINAQNPNNEIWAIHAQGTGTVNNSSSALIKGVLIQGQIPSPHTIDFKVSVDYLYRKGF